MVTRKRQPTACTLQGSSYQQRLAWIAELAREGLRGHDRAGLTLELRYAPHVAEQVREMVRREQDCCAFLDFQIDERATELRLTITAPEVSREIADAVFAPFLPSADK